MNYKFELTEQEAQFVLNVLSELPFKTSAPLIQKIQIQAEAQQIHSKTEKKGEKN